MEQRKCLTCGQPLVLGKNSQRKKFCNRSCQNKYPANAKKQLEWHRKKRGRYEKNKIQCQICKKWYVQLCSHVIQVHKLNNREYKKLIGKDLIKGVVPDWYHELKSKDNLENKDIAWKNLKKGKKYWYKKGDNTAGVYERSKETLDRLRNKQRPLINEKNRFKE